MRLSASALSQKVRSSLWFVPSMMVAAAAVLSFLAVAVDRRLIDAPGRTFLLYGGGAEGARAVLGTVAASMMTVAGVVFSVTIVALSLASQQFGPRVLRNFMDDTGNQVVLGTFISTFVYCILVARTVRGGDEYQFGPHIAVTGGVFLAVISLGVLIYFIHHVANSIRAETIIARVAEDLDSTIERLYPQQIGEEQPQERWARDAALNVHTELRVQTDGYVETIDERAVMTVATEQEGVVGFRVRPGQFVVRDQPLVEVFSATTLDERTRRALVDAVVIGSSRTPQQDVEFPLQQLVQIGVRALSPGVNDPFTAMSTIDRVAAGLRRLGGRRFPSELRKDEHGNVRVIAPSRTYAEIATATLRPLREAAERSPVVADYLSEATAFTHEAAADRARTARDRRSSLS